MTIDTQITQILRKDFGARIVSVKAERPLVKLILNRAGLNDDEAQTLEQQVREKLLAMDGVDMVRVVLTAEKMEQSTDTPESAPDALGEDTQKPLLIAVASGKGGVGKSTIATNLAVALHKLGYKIGMVDADIYGPSQPRLLGCEGAKPEVKDKQLVPVDNDCGIPVLSMGHIAKEGQAIAWRGPMAGNALGQLVDGAWGDKEILIVDMPPGTGDVQLSILQKHKPDGVVIVSTPQDLALIDARRALSLFEQGKVPIIGFVENMAAYICPHCNEVSHPFGTGGAEKEAAEAGMDFLGRILLHGDIRTDSDNGTPPALGDSLYAQAFGDIAQKIAAWLDKNRR